VSVLFAVGSSALPCHLYNPDSLLAVFNAQVGRGTWYRVRALDFLFVILVLSLGSHVAAVKVIGAILVGALLGDSRRCLPGLLSQSLKGFFLVLWLPDRHPFQYPWPVYFLPKLLLDLPIPSGRHSSSPPA